MKQHLLLGLEGEQGEELFALLPEIVTAGHSVVFSFSNPQQLTALIMRSPMVGACAQHEPEICSQPEAMAIA